MANLRASRSPRADGAVLFALLCLAWGSGWIALKIGVAAVPPVFFAGARFGAAGVLLLGWLGTTGALRALLRVPLAQVLPGTLLMITCNYGLMAWGMTRVASGVAAVVNLTTVPLAMAALGALYGRSRWTWRAGAGLALGSVGLASLFSPALGQLLFSRASGAMLGNSAGAARGASALGLAAIVAGAVCYAWGSILIQRRAAETPPLALSAFQALIGGVVLLAASGVIEPWAGIPQAFLAPARFGGWLFLVAISVFSTPAYLALLARWEPARVATYAYICPVIALLEGVAFAGETISLAEAAGAAILGLSAALVLGTGAKRHGAPALSSSASGSRSASTPSPTPASGAAP